MILMALKTINGLCSELKENKIICERVVKRHMIIWEELKKIDDADMLSENNVIPQYGKALVKTDRGLMFRQIPVFWLGFSYLKEWLPSFAFFCQVSV